MKFVLFALASLVMLLPAVAQAVPAGPGRQGAQGPRQDHARTEQAQNAFRDCLRNLQKAAPETRAAMKAQCKTKSQAVRTAFTQDNTEARQKRAARKGNGGKNGSGGKNRTRGQ